MQKILALLFPFILLLSWGSKAIAVQGSVVLSQQVEYLIDNEAKESFESILALPQNRWTSAQDQVVNFGFSSAVHWFRLQLPSCLSPEQKRVFEIAYPPLDDVSVWELVPNRAAVVHQMGDQRPFHERPIQHVSFAVPVGCHDATTLLLRVQSTSAMQLPLVLWDKDAFYAEASHKLMPQFFYFGAMLVMALYNFFVFVSVRKSSYLFYVLFTLSFATFQSGLNGMGFRYIWPNLPFINDFSIDKSLNLVSIFALAFALHYMRVKEHFPKLYRYSALFVWTIAGYHLISFFLPYRIAIKCTIFFIMAGIGLGFWVNLKCILNRQREGYFYIVAWSMFLNGALVLALNKLGLMPRNMLTENSVQLASLLEALLLSFALADQLNTLRRNLTSSHRTLEAALNSIETTVAEKTEDIRSILRTVQQGIMTVRGH